MNLKWTAKEYNRNIVNLKRTNGTQKIWINIYNRNAVKLEWIFEEYTKNTVNLKWTLQKNTTGLKQAETQTLSSSFQHE